MADLVVCLAMDNTEPYVQVACLAEQVLVEPDNVTSAIRITDTMNMVLPADLPADVKPAAVLKALIILKSGSVKGQFEVDLVLTSPSQKSKSLGIRTVDLQGGISGATMTVSLTVAGIEFGEPYWLDVLWGSEKKKLTSIPFRFTRLEATKQTEQS